MGLMVDEIIDVVEDRLKIELAGTRPGMLGTAVIAGKSTDVIDTSYWLTQASHDWFHGTSQHNRRAAAACTGGRGQRFLPPVADADAVGRRLQGDRPGLGGGGAAAARRRARCSTPSSPTSRCPTWTATGLPARCAPAAPWVGLPMIALSARSGPADVEIGRDAGFTDYVVKFDRDALLAKRRAVPGGTDHRLTTRRPYRTPPWLTPVPDAPS